VTSGRTADPGCLLQLSCVNQAQPAFVYSGYTFELADPWPTEWSYDDDCYIDYVDENYYLFDVYHPGVRRMLSFCIQDLRGDRVYSLSRQGNHGVQGEVRQRPRP
jgi:hypothetical protein